jgi:hypothetical protein
MAGRHSKRRRMRAPILERGRSRPLSIIDAQTRLEHFVTEQSLVTHRHAVRFPAICGTEVLAASLTDPGRGRCPECAR